MPDSTDGKWGGRVATPGLFSVHATLLTNGKVLLFSGSVEGSEYPLESIEWDPNTDISTAERSDMPMVKDLFCSHHAILEDGRVLVVGGSGENVSGGYVGDWGIKAICIYDPSKPVASRWEKIGDMNEARWYPTLVTLPDGKLVAFSGIIESNDHAASVELFSPPFKGPGYVTQTISGGDKTFPSYPGMLLVKGGKIVHCATTWQYRGTVDNPVGTFSFVRTGTNGTWIDESTFPNVRHREEGTFVLLPPAQDGKILLLGGGNVINSAGDHATGSELNSAEILDTQTTPFAWQRIDNMNKPRVNPSAVILPNGQVLVIGGHNSYKWSNSLVASNQAELYDPILDTWTSVATISVDRQYHSIAILLQDGKVLVGGGVVSRNDEHSVELYEPPYFFNGTRPTITSLSRSDGPDDTIAYGGEILIETPNASGISKVALIRPCSITHHTNTEQRYVALNFVRVSDNMLRVGIVSDPTVAPPGYYMLWIIDNENLPCEQSRLVQLSRRHCRIITDRSHVSKDELNSSGATSFPNAFYVILDGYTPEDLGITTASPTQTQLNSFAPTMTFTSGSGEFLREYPEIVAEPQELLLEDDTLPEGISQKFTFKFRLKFNNANPFENLDGTPIERQDIDVKAEKNGYLCWNDLTLTNQPNPYMVDGETHWLSTDVRVFQISAGDTRFGQTIGNNESGATTFIQSVLSEFNTNTSFGNSEFGNISVDQTQSKLELARSKDGKRVFNFAIAKVRYRGKTLNADDVRVFFRLFTTAATGLDYRQASTYKRITNTNSEPISILGTRGGEIVTIPFFAEPRVNTAVSSMNTQRDINNRRTINAIASGETTEFFGCWLDINQTALRFPIHPSGLGPFSSGLKSIQELIRGQHQCLVAEVFFTPDPILEGETPASNDNLSQRNLAIVESDNPGNTASHTVQHTFEIKANSNVGIGTVLKAPEFTLAFDHGEGGHHTLKTTMDKIENDELMIQWGNLPRHSQATLFIPDIKAEDIYYLTSLKIGPERIKVVDDHTLELLISDVTYITIPSSPNPSIPALLTVVLPDDVKRGQVYNISLMQIEGVERQILGAFEFVIPVSTAELILPEEERNLSVFMHIAESIPLNNHWKPIFDRYLIQKSEKVRGLGGKPELILPSPDGDGILSDPSVTRDTLSIRCTSIGIGISLLLGIIIGAIGSGSFLLAIALFIVLLFAVSRYHDECEISSEAIIVFLMFGLLFGIILLLLLS